MKKIIAVLFIVVSMLAAKHEEKKVTIDLDRTIYVEGAITGVSSRNAIETITRLEKDKSRPIDIVFNSPGGELLAGYLVVDRIEAARSKGITVRCFVRGVAASMAFQMLLHCDERYAAPHALLLWHPVRIFWMGPLTASDASLVAKHLGSANRTILAELKKYMSELPIKELMWHYRQESLHQAVSLNRMVPSFFDYIGSDIVNLYEPSSAVRGRSQGEDEDSLNVNNINYIHERFLKGSAQ
jgi:ATP-dependent protease ClpP protease subunit